MVHCVDSDRHILYILTTLLESLLTNKGTNEWIKMNRMTHWLNRLTIIISYEIRWDLFGKITLDNSSACAITRTSRRRQFKSRYCSHEACQRGAYGICKHACRSARLELPFYRCRCSYCCYNRFPLFISDAVLLSWLIKSYHHLIFPHKHIHVRHYETCE